MHAYLPGLVSTTILQFVFIAPFPFFAKPTMASRTRSLPRRDRAADPAENVFISLDSTAREIRDLVFDDDTEQVVFVRAAVAAGKTTLAHFLARTFPLQFVLMETGQTEDEWDTNLKRLTAGAETARDSVREIQRQNKVIIIDEAHLLFGCAKIYSALTKLWLPQVRLLLFSAASTGMNSKGNLIATPDNVYHKYMWYPPLPDAALLAVQLEEAGIFLDDGAVAFLMKVCCGHRGIFMMAMRWVGERQKEIRAQKGLTVDSQNRWNTETSIMEVRRSFEEADKRKRSNMANGWDCGLKRRFFQCRAVKVNGDDAKEIPREFVDIVFSGSKTKDKLHGKERDLTIAGLLIPEQTEANAEKELVEYDWKQDGTRYGVALSGR